MKTSARNHFTGRVATVVPGAVNDEIEIELAGGRRIVAVVTRSSAAGLGLSVGASAFALVKASSVIVATEVGASTLSARNRFDGRVLAVQRGAVNSDVTIDAGGDLVVSAIVTQASVDALGLAPGVEATAFFKASSVIVGVD